MIVCRAVFLPIHNLLHLIMEIFDISSLPRSAAEGFRTPVGDPHRFGTVVAVASHVNTAIRSSTI